MNCKIRVTSVVGGETVSPTDMKLIPAGRNTGIQLCIKDTGCGLKQTLQIHPYIYGCIFFIQKKTLFLHSIILLSKQKK